MCQCKNCAVAPKKVEKHCFSVHQASCGRCEKWKRCGFVFWGFSSGPSHVTIEKDLTSTWKNNTVLLLVKSFLSCVSSRWFFHPHVQLHSSGGAATLSEYRSIMPRLIEWRAVVEAADKSQAPEMIISRIFSSILAQPLYLSLLPRYKL